MGGVVLDIIEFISVGYTAAVSFPNISDPRLTHVNNGIRGMLDGQTGHAHQNKYFCSWRC